MNLDVNVHVPSGVASSVASELWLLWAEMGLCEHAETLLDAVKNYPDPTVVELGVRTCVSTAIFLAAIEEHAGRLWSVDIREPYGSAFPRLLGHPAWSLTICDDLAPAIVRNIPDHEILFVDTSHTYEHTLGELVAYTPHLRPGGVVLMHDTNVQYADDSGTEYPVKRAVAEFMRRQSGWLFDNSTDRYGLGAMWRA